jgi:hypothetical protein
MLKPAFLTIVAVLLALAAACGKPTGVPEPSPTNTQKLPFDRESRSTGVSPTQSLIPPTRLNEGTSLTVRLQKPLSSATASAGDSFEGIIDEPVVVDDQPLIARGAAVTGRVLDAKHSGGNRDPGYLRIALVSIDVAGKTVLIDTSSIFAKAKSPSKEGRTAGGADVPNREIVFTPDRRLTFRLAQAADLP